MNATADPNTPVDQNTQLPTWVLPAAGVGLVLVLVALFIGGSGEEVPELSVGEAAESTQLGAEPDDAASVSPVSELSVSVPETTTTQPTTTTTEPTTTTTEPTTTESSTTTAPTVLPGRPLAPGSFDSGNPETVVSPRVELFAEPGEGLDYRFRVYTRNNRDERIQIRDSRWTGSSRIFGFQRFVGRTLWWTVETRDAEGNRSGESEALFFYVSG